MSLTLQESILDAVGSHLSFLGYTVTQDDEAIVACHGSRLNMRVRPCPLGILHTAAFQLRPGAYEELDLLSCVNDLNKGAFFGRWFVMGPNSLCVETFYDGVGYDRERYGAFLGNSDLECRKLMSESTIGQFLD